MKYFTTKLSHTRLGNNICPFHFNNNNVNYKMSKNTGTKKNKNSQSFFKNIYKYIVYMHQELGIKKNLTL